MKIDEDSSGRLERLLAQNLRRLSHPSAPQNGQESSREEGRPPDVQDAEGIAARIRATSSLSTEAAIAVANDIVDRATKALLKLAQNQRIADVKEEDAIALEAVLHVRGRPAIRVLDDHLESLKDHPGSELWQEFISEYEGRIVSSSAATGAAIVRSVASGYPPWLQGSAWLAARDRVVTNRHVLLPDDPEKHTVRQVPGTAKMQLSGDYAIDIEFAADDRQPSDKIPRRVTNILYCAHPQDPLDIAILAIEPYDQVTPLKFANADESAPDNLFVVGHPALMANIPKEVLTVFGKLDGRKRVSFGKRLNVAGLDGTLPYDASTVGGYSGAPVLGICEGGVAGLHYYGNPAAGNLAIPAHMIRAHTAYQWIAG